MFILKGKKDRTRNQAPTIRKPLWCVSIFNWVQIPHFSFPAEFFFLLWANSSQESWGVCIIHTPSSGNKWKNPPRKRNHESPSESEQLTKYSTSSLKLNLIKYAISYKELNNSFLIIIFDNFWSYQVGYLWRGEEVFLEKFFGDNSYCVFGLVAITSHSHRCQRRSSSGIKCSDYCQRSWDQISGSAFYYLNDLWQDYLTFLAFCKPSL